MKFEIDLDFLIKIGLSPNEYTTLKLLSGGSSHQIELFVNRQKMLDQGWMTSLNEITDKGRELFGNTKVSEWIDEWRELFPAGVKSGGYNIRTDKNGCLKKMSAFVKNYPKFTKELIFEATKYYLAVQKKEQYKFCQLAHYFILKNDNSTLGSFCEEVKDSFKGNKPNIKDDNSRIEGI